MTDKPTAGVDSEPPRARARRQRLAEALRANLAKRKARQRACTAATAMHREQRADNDVSAERGDQQG